MNTGIKQILREVPISFEGKAVRCSVYMALSIYCLFNYDIDSSNYVTSNVRTIENSELEGTWKEAVVNYFVGLSSHLPGGTEEIQGKPQSG
jgi:hypothetical protein